MMKRYEGVLFGKSIVITKLNAEYALSVHAELTSMISKSLPELMEGAGLSEAKQMEAFGKAVQYSFEGAGAGKFVSFIKKALTSGDVILEGNRVTHLNDFEKWEDIDGSLLMYEAFSEWLKLNFGGLLKKAGTLLG